MKNETLLLLGLGTVGLLFLLKRAEAKEVEEVNIVTISCEIPETITDGEDIVINVTLTAPITNTSSVTKDITATIDDDPSTLKSMSITILSGETITETITFTPDEYTLGLHTINVTMS